MRRWAGAALAALVAMPAFGRDPVPPAAWRLDPSSAWTDGDRALLDDVERALPAAATASRPLTLVRRPANPLPEDVGAPHTVVGIPRGGVVEVRLDGLQARVAAWQAVGADMTETGALATALVRRQLAHALSHHLDAREGWSRTPEWTRMSGWGAVLRRREPAERDGLDYANVHGRISPAEDLATLGERFLVTDHLPGDVPFLTRCRMPSKWRFLEARLGSSGEPGACATLADVGLDPNQVESVDLLYIRASTQTPASLLGHVLVSVVYHPDRRGRREDVYELVAVTDGVKPQNPAFVVRGLTGGFLSMVRRVPYHATVLRYAEQDRGIERYRLKLDEARERLVLERLDELRQGWRRPYAFLTRNCTQLPKELLETALGEPLKLPPIYGPDALLGLAARRGLVEPVPPAWIEEYSPRDRAVAAHGLREEVEADLHAVSPDLAPLLSSALDKARSRHPLERAEAYRALSAMTPDLAAASVAEPLREWLVWTEQLERLRRVGARRPLTLRRKDPAMDALWSATARAETFLGEQASPSSWQDELLTTLKEAPRGGTAHTPLLSFAMSPGMRVENGHASPWLFLERAVYDFSLGETRRFSVATGLDARLFAWELAVPLDGTLRVRGRGAMFEVRRVLGYAPLANPGFYGRLVEARLTPSERTTWDVTGLEVGGVLELAQAGDHRQHLGVSGGIAAGGRDAFGEALAVGAAALPLRVFGRLGSTEAMTALDLEGLLRPTWTVEGRLLEAEARLGARLRLGAVRGIDVALAASHAVAMSREGVAPWSAPTHEARLGVAFEPY